MEISNQQVKNHLRQMDPNVAKNIFAGIDLDEFLDEKLDGSESQPREADNNEHKRLDDFDPSFKPLTKGLGFNQQSSQPTLRPSMAASKKVGAKSRIKDGRLQLDDSEVATKLMDQRMGLEAFYDNNKQKNQQAEIPSLDVKPQEEKQPVHVDQEKKEDKQVAVRKKVKTAGAGYQLMAWIVDMVAVLAITIATLHLLVTLAGVSANFVISLLSVEELILHLGTFVTVFYLAYFSLLDTRCTLGKWLMGIRVHSYRGRRISLGQSFIRSMVVLISIFLLGLPLMMDFQGKLSTTRLVR